MSNPVPELVNLRNGTVASEPGIALSPTPHPVGGSGAGAAASADILVSFNGVDVNSTSSFGLCLLSNGTLQSGLGVSFTTRGGGGGGGSWWMPGVDITGGDYNVTNVDYSDPHICQGACASDSQCKAYTYVTRPPKTGSCCLKNHVGPFANRSTCTSGVKAPAPNTVDVRVGTCSELFPGGGSLGSTTPPTTLTLAPGAPITLRALPDRSVADFFVNGGAFAGTVTWDAKAPPRLPGESVVLVVAPSGAGVTADVEVYSMGCGWVDPSYTEHPNL